MTSNKDIAIKFAQGRTKGKGSNMFIDGDTIYSYGYHFPIAIRTDWGYYFNRNKYSTTTQRHQSHVRNAMTGKVIELNTECIKLAVGGRTIEPDCIAHYCMRLSEAITMFEGRMARARTSHMKGYWAGKIAENKYIIDQLQGGAL